MIKEVVPDIQDEYPDDVAMCYVCGMLNETGLHFRTGWLKDKTITIFTPKKEHTAIPGFVYGGILASFIDCHGTGSASLALHREKGHEQIGRASCRERVSISGVECSFDKKKRHERKDR